MDGDLRSSVYRDHAANKGTEGIEVESTVETHDEADDEQEATNRKQRRQFPALVMARPTVSIS